MMTNTLELTTERGGRWIRFRGDLNYATVDDAAIDFRDATADADGPVVLDMRELGLLASMGIEMLLGVAKSANAGPPVLLVNPFVEEVLTVARVTRFFSIAHTEAEALEAAGL